MAIECYTGTPGSGKSYDVARMLVDLFHTPTNIITNFPLNTDMVSRHRRQQKNVQTIYLDNSDMTVQYFIAFAQKYHKLGKENQCTVIIDEAQVIFNCRDFSRSDRMGFVNFFTQHRKYGFNFILVTQNIRMIDRQIRNLIETEVVHRKINNYGKGGMIISMLIHRPVFVSISKWVGGNNLVTGHHYFIFSKKTAKLYNSYKLFDYIETGDVIATEKILSCGVSQLV